jgi:hypothetical protein
MVKFIALGILAAAAAPAIAQTAAPATQAAPAPQAAKPQNPLDKIVCRYEDTVGTRLGGHKVCATLREWQEQERDNQDATQKWQQQTSQTGHSG